MSYFDDNEKDIVEDDNGNVTREPESTYTPTYDTYTPTYVDNTYQDDTYKEETYDDEYYEEQEVRTIGDDTYSDDTTAKRPVYTVPSVHSKSNHATLSLVFGILSLICSFGCLGLILAILSIVFYKKDANENGGKATQLSVIGLVLSIFSIISSVVLSIISILYVFALGSI